MSNILITGASGDIGLATAEKFASAGHNLALFGNNNYDKLISASDILKEKYNIDITTHKCDVSDSCTVKKEIEKVLIRFDNIDLLINNAGMSIVGLDQELSDEDWLKLCNVNLSSAMYFCRALIPSMINRKSGKILNISSMWGVYGASCEAAYSATKGGLNAYTKALAKELAPSGISVNALALGAIDTKMNAHLSDEEKTALEEEIPFGRMANVKETAEMIYCIFSAPSYLTGQIIGFDGGY
ncbi:MAG: SDR family NAD(P)-dependent oxidoreductase [Lachnospiraceae bacterium]|nr:SDR family NAD(P)-dependent oxidoreductase [Lachnospiraceae bacterium]